MSKKLSLERDFTRYIDDPTFPHKVTVCVGDRRVICSGILLAQQSSVLEKKFREDNGVLMFEEMLDVVDGSGGILACINYLHGADLQFSIETVGAALKFASLYEVEGLFNQALEWLKEHLDVSKSVKEAVDFLKISNLLNDVNVCYSTQVQSVIRQFIRSNREKFGTELPGMLEEGITGQDLTFIINENLVNSGEILKKWAALSSENREFIVRNYSGIDFPKVFSNTDQFSTFIALMSESASTVESMKFLLDIQKSYFEPQIPINTDPSNEEKSLMPQSGDKRKRDEMEKAPIESPESSKPRSENYRDNVKDSLRKNLNEEDLITELINLGLYLLDKTIPDKEEPATKIEIRDLPSSTSIAELTKLFPSKKGIRSVEFFLSTWSRGNTTAIITFNDKFDALALTFTEIKMNESVLQITIPEQSSERNFSFRDTSLHIGNVPRNADEDSLKQLFSGFGTITEIEIKVGNRGKKFAYITFAQVVYANYLFQCSRTKSYSYKGYELAINRVK